MLNETALSVPYSPIATMGMVTLVIAFIVAAYAAATGIIGNARRRPRMVASSVYGLYAFFALMLLASALMIYAFVTHDYAIKYVSQYSDTSMSVWYKVAAYWGGLNGSLLFWVAVLAVFSAMAVRANRDRHRDMIGYVVATIMLVQLFFLAILIYAKNPFDTFLTQPPPDGEGLNPLLRNYWMVIHPPALYIGFVATTIPFSFGVAALASGRLDDKWLSSVRSWTLISWFFLSFGLILGGRWAYEELGWGGYWAWDPVENAGLLPWFTMTAFLHSVIIQEQRGMMKVWNLLLVVMSFFLTIFGTFMTRSGVVQSVHAFGEDKQLAMLFILFMGFLMIASFGLIIYRLPKLRSKSRFESFVSREFAFLLNNWILLGCAFFVLFATMYPTISEAFDGQRKTVGIPFFNKWMTPLGLILLFLSGAAPLLAWRKSTVERLKAQFMVPVAVTCLTVVGLVVLVPETLVLSPMFTDGLQLPVSLVNFGLAAFVLGSIGQEFWKGVRVRRAQTGSDPITSLIGLTLAKRRKYGGYVVHLGIAVMFVGFAGKAYGTMEDFTVSQIGETFTVRAYTFRYDALLTSSDDEKRTVASRVSVFDGTPHRVINATLAGARAAKVGNSRTLPTVVYEEDFLGNLYPERRVYFKKNQPTTEVSIKSMLSEDVYIVLTGFDESTKRANFRVYINPLVNWVWLGFLFLTLGAFLCIFPKSWVDGASKRRRTRLGRIGEVAVLLLIAGLVTFGFVRAANADQPAAAPAAEYQEAPRHNDGVGYAHRCRPDSPTARKLTHDLICMCGGCKRESLHDCKCGYAAQERCKLLTMLSKYDVGTDSVNEEAYREVRSLFIQEYGQVVLSSPSSKMSWAIPIVAICGALVILFAVGRRWVHVGNAAVATAGGGPLAAGSGTDAAGSGDESDDEDDDEYGEILDDELRDTD